MASSGRAARTPSPNPFDQFDAELARALAAGGDGSPARECIICLDESHTAAEIPCGHGRHLCAACVRKLVLGAAPPLRPACPLCRAEIPRSCGGGGGASFPGLVREVSARFLAPRGEQRADDTLPLLAPRAQPARAGGGGAERTLRRLAMAAVPGRGGETALERERFLARVEEEEQGRLEERRKTLYCSTFFFGLFGTIILLLRDTLILASKR